MSSQKLCSKVSISNKYITLVGMYFNLKRYVDGAFEVLVVFSYMCMVHLKQSLTYYYTSYILVYLIFLCLAIWSRTYAVYEVFERMAYYGISSNLVLYLTTKLHQGVVPSANNVTNWVGTIWMTPIIGAYVADAHLGRYRTFMISSVIYLCVSGRAVAFSSVASISSPLLIN